MSQRVLVWTRSGDVEFAEHGRLTATITRVRTDADGVTTLSVSIGGGDSDETPAYLHIPEPELDLRLEALREKLEEDLFTRATLISEDDETTARVRVTQDPARSPGLYFHKPPRRRE
jgi:hypothetical protein